VGAARILLEVDVAVFVQPLRGALLVVVAIPVAPREFHDVAAVDVDVDGVVRVAVGPLEPPPADDADVADRFRHGRKLSRSLASEEKKDADSFRPRMVEWPHEP